MFGLSIFLTSSNPFICVLFGFFMTSIKKTYFANVSYSNFHLPERRQHSIVTVLYPGPTMADDLWNSIWNWTNDGINSSTKKAPKPSMQITSKTKWTDSFSNRWCCSNQTESPSIFFFFIFFCTNEERQRVRKK